MPRILTFAVGILVIVSASLGRASLYHPEDRTDRVQVDESGKPEPYPFDEFKRRRLVLRNEGTPEWKGEEPKDRRDLAARIEKARHKPEAARTQVEKVALAVDLLRYGRPDEAASVLAKERNGFLPNNTLVHISIAQDSRDRPAWPQALTYLDIASDETTPKELPGMSGRQLAWHVKLNNGPLKIFVKDRWTDSREKRPVEDELPDAIWPVKFVNDAGTYEPGKLAAAEKAKLPGGDFPEAIATVQQLVLWFPFDVRLYWLLGELYAAKGDVKDALDIMNECVNTGRYSNRKVLMEHREVVAKAVAALPGPEPEPEPPPPAVPFSFREVWIYFGVVGVIALFALVRAIWKWTRG